MKVPHPNLVGRKWTSKKSKYKHVRCYVKHRTEEARYGAMIVKYLGKSLRKNSYNTVVKLNSWYDNEREAAIAVDKYLISVGREPVNILKRKK